MKRASTCMWMGLLLGGCATTPSPDAHVASASSHMDTGQAFENAMNVAENGQWKEAATLFASVAQAEPSRWEASLNEGVARERLADWAGAEAAYRRVWDNEATKIHVPIHLARVRMALGDTAGASSVLNDAVTASPDDAELLNAYAGVLRQQRQFDRAADMARRVLLRDQKNVAAMKDLGLIYADEGRLQLAETFFQNALKYDEKDASIHVNLGLIAHRRGEHQAAIAAFQKALELDPNNAVAHANMGAMALKYRDYARAQASYEKALSLGVNSCETLGGLGYALEGLKQGEAAVKQLGKAFGSCKRDTEFLFAMGAICMGQLRDSGCALKHFEAFTTQTKELNKDHRVFQLMEALKSSQSAKPTESMTPATDAPVSQDAPTG